MKQTEAAREAVIKVLIERADQVNGNEETVLWSLITKIRVLPLPEDPELEEARRVLREVMDWIKNWDPNFIHDEEWSATENRVRAVLAKGEG